MHYNIAFATEKYFFSLKKIIHCMDGDEKWIPEWIGMGKYDNLIKRGFKDAYKCVITLILGNCSLKMHINVVFKLLSNKI